MWWLIEVKRAEAVGSLGVGGYEVTVDANGSEVEPSPQ